MNLRVSVSDSPASESQRNPDTGHQYIGTMYSTDWAVTGVSVVVTKKDWTKHTEHMSSDISIGFHKAKRERDEKTVWQFHNPVVRTPSSSQGRLLMMNSLLSLSSSMEAVALVALIYIETSKMQKWGGREGEKGEKAAAEN